MINEDYDLEQLQNMKHTQCQYVNWHEEGGGEVYRVNDVYVLFEIPIFGGEPNYVGTYHRKELNKLVDMAYSWT